MRRNSGIIGPKVKTTETDASGVHDTFDNYNAMKDGNWPLTLNVSSISISFNNTKMAGSFFGWLALKKQLRISKLVSLMRFPCSDSLSYCQLCEGKLDVVIQCSNKIWDVHPMIPLIKNAGGLINTWNNKDAKLAGNIVASSNLKIHKRLLKMLKPVI